MPGVLVPAPLGGGLCVAVGAGHAPAIGAAPVGAVWIRAANSVLHKVGVQVALPMGAVILGGHALCDDPASPGSIIHLIRVDPPTDPATVAATMADANDTPDARVIPIRYGVDGIRYRDFREAVTLMEESPFSDFPITGPRSARWLLTTMAQSSSGPMARHTRWAA